MSIVPAYTDNFEINRVVVRTFDIIRRNLLLLVALTLVLFGLPRRRPGLLDVATDAMPGLRRLLADQLRLWGRRLPWLLRPWARGVPRRRRGDERRADGHRQLSQDRPEVPAAAPGA